MHNDIPYGQPQSPITHTVGTHGDWLQDILKIVRSVESMGPCGARRRQHTEKADLVARTLSGLIKDLPWFSINRTK